MNSCLKADRAEHQFKVPLFVSAVAPFQLHIRIAQGEELLADQGLNVIDQQSSMISTGCEIEICDTMPIRVKGQIKSVNRTGNFDATFVPVDLSPWTGILRDRTLDFGARLDRYQSNIAKLSPNSTSYEFTIEHRELPVRDMAARVAKELGVPVPPELLAFVTRRAIVNTDSYYEGPASRWQSEKESARWPSVTEAEIAEGTPPEYLPAKGTDVRAFYDRVRVVYVNVGDGIAYIIWDPTACEDQPAFFWIEEDTGETIAFEYSDGKPVSAQDALLAPLDWSDRWEYMRTEWLDEDWAEQDYWLVQAIEKAGFDPADKRILPFGMSNTQGHLIIYFEQRRRLPLLRKVVPQFFSKTKAGGRDKLVKIVDERSIGESKV
ncbi:hypothetical protein [Sphingorhabdus sp. EL138]|uniref:hypothetical protein n=1 Tax=Sphingorhabdus sp. EL138 TaxID=2073156 RepID=UPI000D687492|nr:hypothetical protein [Sphingorhabdus sp. EL138]